MLPIDFGKNTIHNHKLPTWSFETSSEYFLQIPLLRFSDDDEEWDGFYGGGGGGGGNWGSEDELREWWHKFHELHKYPLYCMILATDADENVSAFIEKHRKELSEIAGGKCCFVYFRDIEKAKLLEPFRFIEHAKKLMQFIKIIGIELDKLPCVLFFEQIDSGKFVYVGLENRTVQELMGLFRELFTFINSQKEVSLSAVKAFKFSKQIEVTRLALSRNLMQVSIKIVDELIKSLTKLS